MPLPRGVEFFVPCERLSLPSSACLSSFPSRLPFARPATYPTRAFRPVGVDWSRRFSILRAVFSHRLSLACAKAEKRLCSAACPFVRVASPTPRPATYPTRAFRPVGVDLSRRFSICLAVFSHRLSPVRRTDKRVLSSSSFFSRASAPLARGGRRRAAWRAPARQACLPRPRVRICPHELRSEQRRHALHVAACSLSSLRGRRLREARGLRALQLAQAHIGVGALHLIDVPLAQRVDRRLVAHTLLLADLHTPD